MRVISHARLALGLLALTLAIAPGGTAHSDEGPPTVRLEPQRLARVEIVGTLEEPAARLARFLGLVPGAPWDAGLRKRAADGLSELGYDVTRPVEETATKAGVELRISIAPARVVRHVFVKGNWPILRPIFNEDIIRRLTLRPGARLPPEGELPERLGQEAERIKLYLHREGFFEADADVIVRQAGRPDWVDLEVLIHLGRWFSLDADHVYPKGNHAIGREELADKFVHTFPPYFWSRFRLDRMHEDARSAEGLYRDRGYPAARVFPEFDAAHDVNHKSGRVDLRVRVNEKGKVAIHFIGNHALTDKELEAKVTIFATGSYDETELGESARELHRLYQAHGFLEAHVTVPRPQHSLVKLPSGDTVDLYDITFLVDEGQELKVRGVDFAPEPFPAGGALPETSLGFDDKTLRQQVTTKEFPLIGEIGLGEGGYVTTLQLEQDAAKLAAFYRSQGYANARVRGAIARDRAAFNSLGLLAADVTSDWGHNDDVYVRFFVDEGPRELVNLVAFQVAGPPQPALEPTLAKALRIGAGDPYSPEALAAGIKRLTESFQTTGHPYVRIDPSEKWDSGHTHVSLDIAVEPGPEVHFGEILIRGNFRTSDWVIRRDLPFKTGDLYDASKLVLAERNLITHTLFNSVRVNPSPAELPPLTNPVPILVEVQERYDNWGSFEAAVGYATDIGASFSLGYFWGNVFGGGGQLEARFDVAADIFRQTWTLNYHAPFWRLLSATLRYVHPHLFLPSLRGEITGFWRKEATFGLGEVISFGARTSLSWIPSPSFQLYGRLQLTQASLLNIDYQRLPSRGDFTSSVPDETLIGKFTLGAIFDDRTSFEGKKNPLMPIDGWLVAASATTSIPGFAHQFLIFSGQVQRYQPLGRGVSIIANVRGDWGIPLGGEAALPAVERFFAGGDAATRGYDTDRLRTEIVRGDVGPLPGQAGFRVIPQGGNIRMLGTVELQFPIANLGDLKWVGAIFVDAGAIVDEWSLFDPSSDIKASVGLTLLRLLTPVGPLSLEYAYPMVQGPGEELWKKESFLHWPGRIHFNWGIPILR